MELYDFKKIEDLTKYFYAVGAYLLDAPNINPDTFFIIALITRAYQINKGFIELTNNGNYLCAAPLVRMQLETLCRCYGGLIADGTSYAERFMFGKKLDNQTFQGKQLTYTTLVELLSEHQKLTELPRIYKEGNAFIHPTDIAFKASVWTVERKVSIRGLDQKLYDDSEMDALIRDMFYVNLCYPIVIDLYLEQIKWLLDDHTHSHQPVTDPDIKAKAIEKIEQFIKQTQRDSTESNI